MSRLLSIIEADKTVPDAVVAAPNSNLAPFDITVPEGEDPEEYAKTLVKTMPAVQPASISTPTYGRRSLLETLAKPDVKVEFAQPSVPETSTVDEETLAQKAIRGALGVIDIPEKVTKGLVLPFTENIAGQAAGITDFASRAAFGTRGYIQALVGTGSLEKAWDVAKKEAEKAPQIQYQPTTKLGRESLELVGKGFEAVGDIGKGIVRPVLETTKAPPYIKEPVEELAAFATYLLGPKAIKSAVKTTRYVETLVEKGIDPLYLRDHLISKGVDPVVAVGAEKLARQRGLTATVAERQLVEGDRPYVAKVKEAVGIKPGEERIVARLDPQTRGVKLGEEAKPTVEEPRQLIGPEEPVVPPPPPPPQRPTGVDIGRQELPPGQGFKTEMPFEKAPEGKRTFVPDKGRLALTEEKGFVLVEPIDTTPQLNWQKKPFKTESNAEKAALKAGIKPELFEIVKSGEGFAYKRIDPAVKGEVPEVSQIDTLTGKEITPEKALAIKTADEAGVKFKDFGKDADNESYILYEDPLTGSAFAPLKGETIADSVARSRQPFIDAGELDLKKVAEHNAKTGKAVPSEKYAHPTKVKATPMMKEIAKAIEYKGRKFRQGGTLPTQLDSYWTEGTKDTYHFYNVADGRVFDLPTNHPFFEAGAARKLSALPEGVVLVKHTIFQGKDVGLTFWEGTQKATKPAAPSVNKPVGKSLIDMEKITAGVDLTTTKARLLKDAAGYDPIRTVVSELLQNSLDAIGDSKIPIEVRVGDGFLIVSDKGKGMTPQVMSDDFVNLFKQGTKGELDMGGFGFAKLPIMGWPDSFDVISVAIDPVTGKKYTSQVWGTREEYMKNHEVNFDSKETRAPDNTPTGTTVTLKKSGMDSDNVISRVKNFTKSLRTGTNISIDGIDSKGNTISEKLQPPEFKDVESMYKPLHITSGESEIDVKFVKVAPYGGYKPPYQIKTTVMNKGLVLPDIPQYTQLGRFQLSKKPNFTLEINFSKTPAASDVENYPFTNNRTRIISNVESDIVRGVEDVISDLEGQIHEAAEKSLKKSFDGAPVIGGTKIIIPFTETEIHYKIHELIKSEETMFKALGRLYKDYSDMLAKYSDIKGHTFAITTHPDLHGFRPKTGILDTDYIVVNPFSYIDPMRKNVTPEVHEEELRKAGTALTDTLTHEATHQKVSEHYVNYVQAFHEVQKDLGHKRLSIIERKANEFFKVFEVNLREVERELRGIQSSGTLIDVFSDYTPNEQRIAEPAVDEGRGVYAGRAEGVGESRDRGVVSKLIEAHESALTKRGNLSGIEPYVSPYSESMSWENTVNRIEFELNAPETGANPSSRWEAGIRHKGWAQEARKFDNKKEAMQWLEDYDLSKINKDGWGPGEQFFREMFGDSFDEKVKTRITPANETVVRKAIAEAKKNGPSPEFRALFGGITPDIAGTTSEKVKVLADKLGLEYRIPETVVTKLTDTLRKEYPVQDTIVSGSGILLPDGKSLKLSDAHENILTRVREKYPDAVPKTIKNSIQFFKEIGGVRTSSIAISGRTETAIDIIAGMKLTPQQLDAIESVIGKRSVTTLGVYNEAGRYLFGGPVESIKDVNKFINQGANLKPKETIYDRLSTKLLEMDQEIVKAAGEKAPDKKRIEQLVKDREELRKEVAENNPYPETMLYQGFDPIAAVKSLKATAKDIKTGLSYLEDIGQYVFEAGKTKYFEWQKTVKSFLGDMWDKFKKYVGEVWERLKSGKIGPLKNQWGATGPDIAKEAVAKQRRLRMSERTKLNKVAEQYKKVLDKVEQELAEITGKDGKKKFEELKQKRIEKFFEAISKLKQDPAAYRKQGYQRAIEMLKKREYTAHVNHLKASKARLEKMIGKRLEKAKNTADTTDVMAPTILEKDFKRLKSLPDIRNKPLGGFTQNPIYSFEDWGGMVGPKAAKWVKDTFYYPVRKATHKADVHFSRVFNAVEAIRDKLPKESGRRIGIYAFDQEYGGTEILKSMGIKEIPKLTPEEMKAYKWMRGVFDLFYDYVNEGRAAAGKETFGKVGNYFTFAKELSEAERLGFGFDDALLSDYIHAKATTFPYAKHRVGGMTNAQLNAFEVFENYIRTATKHMYLSPEIAKIREYTGQFKYRDDEGKLRTWEMKEKQPKAYNAIQDYADFISGQKKVILPKNVEAAMQMLNKNITYATLSGNLRSALIQPTALLNTYVEIGPYYTQKGVAGLFTVDRIEAIKKSEVLFNREFDISVSETGESITDLYKRLGVDATVGDKLLVAAGGALSKVSKARKAINQSWIGMKPLKFLDMETATATWIGAYKKAIEHDKMAEQDAINYADDTVVRTQGSAAAHDLAPIQRIALGKFATTFQTFVINNFNWLVKDVMGIKNPILGKASMLHKALRYVIGLTLINFVFEDWLDINSPLPSPISAMRREYKKSGSIGHTAVTGGLEMLQLVQGLGGLRYGSSILGAPIEFLGDVSEKVAEFGGRGITSPARKASDKFLELGGEKGLTTRSTFELLGKGLGIPRTTQTVKEIRGLSRGDTVLEAMLGKRVEPKEKSSPNTLRNLMRQYRPKLERPPRPY